jgi:hypothetical protein
VHEVVIVGILQLFLLQSPKTLHAEGSQYHCLLMVVV